MLSTHSPCSLCLALPVLGVLAVLAVLAVRSVAADVPCNPISLPCANGGTCVVPTDGTASYCQCSNGWAGANCSEDIDDCAARPCKNGGTCRDARNRKFTCDCPAGFVGELCQHPDPCMQRPCSPGSTCSTTDLKNWTTRVCTCQPGFQGDDCSQDIDECALASTPACANGGRCVNERGTYRCDCPKGYRRKSDCSEQEIPACKPSTCRNGGTCIWSADRGTYCVCPKDFAGDVCERRLARDCHARPCRHGGRCHLDPGGGNVTCTCRDGWVGDHCEACAEGRCRNGGRCRIRDGDNLTCDCLDGFRGPRCENRLPPPLDPCGGPASRCRNGGTCVPNADTDSFRCDCAVGYQGLNCELQTPPPPPPPSPSEPSVTSSTPLPAPPTPLPNFSDGQLSKVLIGLCSLLGLALLAGVLYALGKRRRESSKGVWFPPGCRPPAGLATNPSTAPMDTVLVQGDNCDGSVNCRLLPTGSAVASTPVPCKRAKFEDTTFLPPGLPKPLTSASSVSTMSSAAAVSFKPIESPMETPLHLAARYCRSDATRHLLESGADPNVPDAFGRTPLHAAIASGAHGVAHLLMVHRGTDVNARADDGSTPLIAAARFGDLEIASTLLACPQVDAGAADAGGKTALHWAASVNAGDIVTLLLCHGANKDPTDIQDRTPLFLAAYEGAADAAARLLEAGANREACDGSGRTAAQAAEARLHLDIVQMLQRCPPLPLPSQQQQPMQLATTSIDCSYSAVSGYPPHHYPTPPSNADDSPPLQQPLHHHHLAGCGVYHRPIAFLTPSPESAQGSPTVGLGQPGSSIEYHHSSQHMMSSHFCYNNCGCSQGCYPPHQREVV